MTWQRLEGGTVDAELTEGIAAALADPLWLLGRQWQMGEFRGEDAATPIMIEGQVVAAPVTEYWVDDGQRRHVVPRTREGWPLETLAEREPITGGPAALRIRLESGAALLRRLAATGAPGTLLNDLRLAYAFDGRLDAELDPLGRARLALLARRSLDGAVLATALDAVGGDAAQLPQLEGLPDGAGSVAEVIEDWRAQEAGLFCDADPDEPSAWSSHRLEYRFGVSAAVPGGAIELEAPEYPGGRLDWFHYDVISVPEPGGAGKPVDGLVRKTLTSLMTPLQFRGMPAARWWEFEDGDVDFGDLAGGPDDLARSVVAAYAMVAGDNWFVVPCSLPSGSLAQVARLRVLDDFGIWTDVPATAVRDGKGSARPWRFFELADDPGPGQGRAPLLFLPPVVDSVEQSRPLEAVELRRDEMANLAWAIERTVESEAGRPVDREAGRTAAGQTVDGDGSGELVDGWRYRLSTDVPDHWVPLVPVRIDTDDVQVVLRRGRIATEAITTGASEQRAKGRILEPEHPFVMHEEEIPAGGLRVTRRYQLARGADGKVCLWVGRHKAPSGGPMRRTPLRFDVLEGWAHQA